MATAGAFGGRLAEVAHSSNGSSYTEIERVNNPRFSGQNDVAESSSNDSAGHKEFIYTWQSGTLSFEMIADEAATGQEAVWSSYLNRTILYWRVRPRGPNVTGDKEYFFQGLVTSMEQSADKGDVNKYSVTVQKTGAITRQNQA